MVPSSSPEPEQPTMSLTRAPPPQPDPKPSLEQVRPALGHHLPHRLPRRPLRRDHRARRPRHALLARRSLARAPAPPTHNREPYDTLLSDTIATNPSVEPMPLSSTRSMRMSVCGVRAPPHGPRTVPCALTRGRPGAPRRPGTGRSRRTARRAAHLPLRASGGGREVQLIAGIKKP